MVGVDMDDDPTTQYLVDAFYRVPAASAPEYCDILLDICRKEKVDIYFPNISAEVSAVVARQGDFDQIGVKLSVSNLESIEISNNKLEISFIQLKRKILKALRRKFQINIKTPFHLVLTLFAHTKS